MRRGQLKAVLRHVERAAGLSAAQGLSDARLLEQYVAHSDEGAFAALVHRYGRLVRSICRHVLGHEEDADDAFQATFLVFAAKAGSIRKATSVASWLYGVAHRTAMSAKRARTRRREEQGTPEGLCREQPVTEAALRELQAILDEELLRLPEAYRAAFVLCCLDGKSKAEAARALGWNEGTVSSRLARARKRLLERLRRRGVVLSAALCVVALGRASAAAPHPSLVKSTIQAALSLAAGKAVAGDLVSTQVAALAKGAFGSMGTTKLKVATAMLLAASLLTGVGLAARQALADKPAGEARQALAPQSPEQAKAPAAPKAAAPKGGAADAVVVEGTVLGPEGKPFEGAKVSVWRSSSLDPTASGGERATTGADGRFRFTVPKDDDATRQTRVVATAKGLAPDWAVIARTGPASDVTLRLTMDDVPIDGRVVDLEGRPLAGVTVEVWGVHKRAGGGDLTPWIEAQQAQAQGKPVKDVPMIGLRPREAGVATSVTTGKDGSFRLAGFGRERVVHLRTRGPTIADGHADVVTRAGPLAGVPVYLHPAKFDFVAAPDKPIVGTVRDRRTGKPLAGIKVGLGGSPASTDAKGQYRLNGLGKRPQYFVLAEGAPYLPSAKTEVKDTPGFDPITVDFEMERGVTVRGRLTDQATGKPVRGTISYAAWSHNPNLKDFSQLMQFFPHAQTGPDGTFAIAAVPGPGLLLAWAYDRDHYSRAEVKDWDGFVTKTVPVGAGEGYCHAVVPINPSEDQPDSTARDIALEPGRKRAGTVVGPDGKPLAGAHVVGLTPLPSSSPSPSRGLETAAFTALGLSPRRARAVVFFHPEKKLGKVEFVRGDDAGPLTVRLEPLGSLAGRVLDAEGRPWAGAKVRAELVAQITGHEGLAALVVTTFGRPLLTVEQTTDREGKFRLGGLLPGLPNYVLSVTDPEQEGEQRVSYYSAYPLAVESGKTKDQGDLKSKFTPKGGKE
jgi:RNA polymerase sigma factor (sigma-70 family)